MFVKCYNVTSVRHLTGVILGNMRKNGTKLISVKQYRATDLFLFALILSGSEVIAYFARQAFPADIAFSFMVPVVLMIMMRWGWPGIIYAAADGAVVCLLAFKTATPYHYAAYIIGNCFIAIMYVVMRVAGKARVRKNAWTAAAFAICGWLCVYVGRSLVWTIAAAFPSDGVSLWGGWVSFSLPDLLSLIMAAVILPVMRKFDGMFEDQMEFLARVDREKRERMRIDQMGENMGEIDEETLKEMLKNDDLY